MIDGVSISSAAPAFPDCAVEYKRSGDSRSTPTSKLQGDHGGALNYAQSSVRLKAPLTDTGNPLVALFSPSSRADTVAYYANLCSTLTTIAQSTRFLGGVELDLSSLVSPPEIIDIIEHTLSLPLRLTNVAIKLGFEWSSNDQNRLIQALNQPRERPIDELKLFATTTETFATVLHSLPTITQCHSVVVVDKLPYSKSAPASEDRFSRVLLTPRGWAARKLTLPMTEFDDNHNHFVERASSGQGSGLESLEVHVSDQCVTVLLHALPHFGVDLRSLKIYVRGRNGSVFHLGSLIRAYPRLRELMIDGPAVTGVDDLCEWIEAHQIPLTSLKVRGVVLCDLKPLTRVLSDHRSVLSKNLQTVEIIQRGVLLDEDLTDFELVLTSNKRLEVLTLGGVGEEKAKVLRLFNREPLPSCKHALLSVMHATEKGSMSALGRLDMWSVSEIIRFAGLSKRRRVVLQP